MLTLENIDLSYAEPPVHAVADVSFEIPAGTIVALLGSPVQASPRYCGRSLVSSPRRAA